MEKINLEITCKQDLNVKAKELKMFGKIAYSKKWGFDDSIPTVWEVEDDEEKQGFTIKAGCVFVLFDVDKERYFKEKQKFSENFCFRVWDNYKWNGQKTIKKTVLEKRIETAKRNKTIPAKGNVLCSIEDILDGETKIRTGYYTGSGRWTSAVDFTDDLICVLSILGIAYKKGNDAPRGGVNGNFIKIKTKII